MVGTTRSAPRPFTNFPVSTLTILMAIMYKSKSFFFFEKLYKSKSSSRFRGFESFDLCWWVVAGGATYKAVHVDQGTVLPY